MSFNTSLPSLHRYKNFKLFFDTIFSVNQYDYNENGILQKLSYSENVHFRFNPVEINNDIDARIIEYVKSNDYYIDAFTIILSQEDGHDMKKYILSDHELSTSYVHITWSNPEILTII